MFPKLLYFILICAIFTACETGEKEVLQSQVDSLRSELEKSHQTSQTLAEIGTLLDSIDATRQLLRVNLVEGTPYDDYTGRMEDLHQYIRNTEEKIARLEQSLQSSAANARAFSKTIQQLKAEVKKKEVQMAFLQEQVEKFRNENENLIITVNLQDAEIADKQEQIDARSQELALIEARVQELMIQAKVSEADAYYTRAVAIETAANRTKLAPRKKKETMREALDLYKKALSLGKREAQAKIAQLETKL
jgi:DNA repair exonuclease SbcCD ATPase subunit